MEFNRRSFLAAIVAGASFTSVGNAFGSMPDRYTVLVSKLSDLYNAADRDPLGLYGVADQDRKAKLSNLYSLVEGVIKHLLQNFGGGDNLTDARVTQQLRDLFDNRENIDTLDETNLRELEDAIVVFAAMRTIIFRRIPLDNEQIPSFAILAERYHCGDVDWMIFFLDGNIDRLIQS